MVNTGGAGWGLADIFYRSRDHVARIITIYENRANLLPGDIETRTVSYNELKAQSLLEPMGPRVQTVGQLLAIVLRFLFGWWSW